MNEFDAAWNEAVPTETAIFGGEMVTSGVQSFPVTVLEFDRNKVIGAIGGLTQQVSGQVVMTRADWTTLAAGKNSVPVTLRGFAVRLQMPVDSPDLNDVVLNVLAAVQN